MVSMKKVLDSMLLNTDNAKEIKNLIKEENRRYRRNKKKQQKIKNKNK